MSGGFRASRAWTARAEGSTIRLAAGADRGLRIDAPDADAAARFAAAWECDDVERDSLSWAVDREAVLGELVTIGALSPCPGAVDAATSARTAPLRVALAPVGTALDVRTVRTLLAAHPGDGWAVSSVGDGSSANAADDQHGRPIDLVVVLRSGGTLLDAAEAALPLGGHPHVLVDAAFDHTVGVGPYVADPCLPCIGCLARRVGERWGDDDAPASPNAARDTVLVAGVVARELTNIAAGASALVGATASVDVARWTTVTSALHRHPACPSHGAAR